MRGGITHNQVLIAPTRALLIRRGAVTHTEFRVEIGGGVGFIDLLADMPGGTRIAVEAELTSRRVELDLRKAAAACADVLCVVTPCPASSRRCQRAVARAPRSFSGEIVVRPFGPMCAALAQRFSLVLGVDCGEKQA